MPVDPADPFATPASTKQEHDARMALVAELRAAREIIEVASRHLIGLVDHGVLRRAIDAYDKVVKEASDGQSLP